MSGILVNPYIFGGGGGGGGGSLYAFTSFTFGDGGLGAVPNGPTLSNCLATYSSATYPWITNTSYFNVVTAGYQRWTVPKTGTYRITAKGASGGGQTGSVGRGAQVQGDFSLTAGQILVIAVGHQGQTATEPCSGNSKGSGGGGTFVINDSTSLPLIVAGGGGGTSLLNGSNLDAQATLTAGKAGLDTGGAGGSGGAGGATNPGCVPVGGGGGGFSSAGGNGGDANGGATYSTGLGGGTVIAAGSLAGGFGGGGGAGNYTGGGGGGYSGGGAGGVTSCSCTVIAGGGGGGSINNGTNPVNTDASNTGQGSVTILAL